MLGMGRILGIWGSVDAINSNRYLSIPRSLRNLEFLAALGQILRTLGVSCPLPGVM